MVFPLSTSGIVYDLIVEIRQYLATMGIEIGAEDASQITLYMASPVADKSLQYSNICGEWYVLHSSSKAELYLKLIIKSCWTG